MNIESKYFNFNQIKFSVDAELLEVGSPEEVGIVWRKYLGKDGLITEMLKKIKDIPSEERKQYGNDVNVLKNYLDEYINSKKDTLVGSNQEVYFSQVLEKPEYRKPKVGHLHPLTETTMEMNEVFRKLGFSVMDGPELETDEYCFQRLNLPLHHPARDLQDSIFIEEPNILLRTQTSSIEARVLEEYEPPFKVVMPGRVFRNEKVNRTNHFTFHQYQLTVVKEKVSMTELFSVIDYLFKSVFGSDVKTRFRCKYYPEVEPGVGPDMLCFNCKGDGCPICKQRGWIEMGGAGIIHPNVLQMAGLDPKKYQGYAFGMGLDRWTMARHNISDIRTLLDGNLVYKD